jgi:hypothetical protein
MSSLSITVEAEVVARLARGDTQTQIASDLQIAPNTITRIKDRQSQALEAIGVKVAQRKQRITSRILDKAHRQLEQRLDESDNYEQLLKEIHEEFEESQQTEGDKAILNHKLGKLKKLSVLELINITKEAFHQSQVEQGKPTSVNYTADAKTTKEQLDQLLEAMNGKDDGRLIELASNDLSQSV